MVKNITITGASGNSAVIYGVPDNTDGDSLLALDLQIAQDVITEDLKGSTSKAVSLPQQEGTQVKGGSLIGFVDPEQAQGQDISINGQYQYVIIPGYEDTTITRNPVSLQAVGTSSNNNVTIIGGYQSGFSYTAGNESGTVLNTIGNLNFNAAGKTGKWDIETGSGDTNIHTGIGKSTIIYGTGKTSIYAEGQAHIEAASDEMFASNNHVVARITLAGGSGYIYSGVGTSISDLSSNNEIITYQNSTINGGTDGSISLRGYYDENIDFNVIQGNSTIQGGSNNTVSSIASNITAVHTVDNNFESVIGSLTFLNGYGDTNVSIYKQFIGFGASGLNLTLNSCENADTNYLPFTGESLFVADKGNETLNASGYNNTIQIYANTVAGAQSSLVATGGNKNDYLTAGTGNSTFTGGAGDNLFIFQKESTNNGNTVITDFMHQGSSNHIGLYNYGYNTENITQLLKDSHNDNQGNAVLNLENHKITLEGITVTDLKVSQFIVSDN